MIMDYISPAMGGGEEDWAAPGKDGELIREQSVG